MSLGRQALNAVPAIAAALAAFLATYALCVRLGTNPSPAVLAAALCIGLMRRPEELVPSELARKFVMLPLIGLAAGLVGWTFLHLPIVGAVLFTSALALSVWLRQFGERWASIGRTIALPMMSILIVPIAVDSSLSKTTAALLVLGAGAIAFLCATGASYLGAVLGWVEQPKAKPAKPQRAPREGTISVPSRMALQMLVALALGFAIGLALFPTHWPWIVLSAFIVTSGAVGRGDAIYKAIQRLLGAIGGTFVAALLAHVSIPNPSVDAAVIFVVLYVGIWLRQVNYAYWAACATLIFALLQGAHGDDFALFGTRVLCIFIGALCGVVATWFVYPIRTEQVVRRRVADVLGALKAVLSGEAVDLDHHAEELKRVSPPVRLHRAVFGARNPDEHPATWIERAHALLDAVRSPDFDRKHVGAEMRHLRSLIVNEPPPQTKEE